MPTVTVTARVSPYVRDRLMEQAAERRTTLSGLLASVVTEAVDDAGPGLRAEGSLVTAVRAVLGESDGEDPRAAVDRELCLLLARTVERREPGFLAAIGPLKRALSAAAPSSEDEALNQVLNQAVRLAYPPYTGLGR
ncbi:hypothetical protein [Streptomyces sp. GSL17-111]|uniref:hypothetical protein n=1 Tax=Streptomyces sp. GSL17-111 TaxID=3121596 RepID=UPI0030F4317B